MRLFIGLPFADDARQTLKSLVTNAPTFPGHLRLENDSRWHITLAFLGEVDEKHIPDVVEVMQQIFRDTPPDPITIDRLATFPAKHPVYLAVLGSAGRTWHACVNHLRERISLAIPTIDRKPWYPHITIGRPQKNTTLPSWEIPLTPFAWKPDRVCLMKSEQRPTGSVYTDIHVIPLNI